MSLVGKTEAVSPSEIITDLTEVNNDINSQADLIAQISTALEGKGVGSGAPVEPVLQDKTIIPTEDDQIITADEGYDGLNKVTIEAIPDSYLVDIELFEQDQLINNIFTALEDKTTSGDGINAEGKTVIFQNSGTSANTPVYCNGLELPPNTDVAVFCPKNASGKYVFTVALFYNYAAITETEAYDSNGNLISTAELDSIDSIYTGYGGAEAYTFTNENIAKIVLSCTTD